MKIDGDTSRKIKNMSLLCAALVVTIHIGLPKDLGFSVWLIDQLTASGFSRIAVPFFFVASGYLLAVHIGEHNWWKMNVRKRFASILVPFFIWSSIWIIELVTLSIIGDLNANRSPGCRIMQLVGNNTWLQLIGIDITSYPSLVPLWFIRCLFIYVLFSPAIVWAIKTLKGLWFVGCFCLSLVCNPILLSDSINECTVVLGLQNGLFYFSCGILFRNKQSPMPTNSQALLAAGIGLALLVAKIIFCYYSMPYHVLAGKVSIPFMLLAVWHIIPSRDLPDWLLRSTFPVYLMHPLFFPLINTAFWHFGPHPVSPILVAFVKFVFGFLGPVIVAVLLRKTVPKTAKIIFGGR